MLLWLWGWPKRAIARDLGVSYNRVRRRLLVLLGPRWSKRRVVKS